MGVAIVSWNVADYLGRCLKSVLASRARRWNIVVVDNASSDNSVSLVKDMFPSVEMLVNHENAGFSRANNQALKRLGAIGAGEKSGVGVDQAPTTVVLLNPDTEVKGDALATLAEYLEGHPDVGAVGPKLLWPDGHVQSSRRRFPTLATGLLESTPLAWMWYDNPIARRFRMDDIALSAGRVDWVTGACIALRAEAVRAVGGLDEGYFMYSEELDLCRRLRDAGWTTHFTPAAEVVHHEGRSSEQAVPERHLNFHRSRVRYFRKYHGPVIATIVRVGILTGYAGEALLEAMKLAVGHRPELRRSRLRAYTRILADGLRQDAGAPAP